MLLQLEREEQKKALICSNECSPNEERRAAASPAISTFASSHAQHLLSADSAQTPPRSRAASNRAPRGRQKTAQRLVDGVDIVLLGCLILISKYCKRVFVFSITTHHVSTRLVATCATAST